MEREPSNRHDKNAIRVIGCNRGFFGTKRYFIGYVPANVSKAIVEGGYFDRILPRLLKTYEGDTGYVEILFQILGPKGERHAYEQASAPSPDASKLGKGAHYSDFVSQVKYLKKQKQYQDAIDLLLKLVAATEKEASREKMGVAPWYYEQLAVIYRKEKKFDEEIAILERYEQQPKAPGVGPEKLTKRLREARAARNERQA